MNGLQLLWQVNFYLVLFYGFYRLLLYNETFYNLNRTYLVGSVILSFLIPLWQSDSVQSWFITQQVQATYSIMLEPTVVVFQKSVSSSFTWSDLLIVGYFSGILVFTIRLIIKLLGVKSAFKNPINKAFSFFNRIVVDEELPNRKTILIHENVHVQHLHSLDVLLFEIVAIFCWFNPIVYFYKQAIKHIHEFTADEVAAQKEASKAAYAMLLFSQQFGVKPHELTNSFFNQSLLKRRIMMLSKPRSRRTALLKYGLSVPLFVVMLIFSSATIAKNEVLKKYNGITVSVNLPDRPVTGTDTLAKPQKKAAPARSVLKGEEVFSTVEQIPEFPGGQVKMFEYIGTHLIYPKEAIKAHIQGKVLVKFIVRKDGWIANVKITKGIGHGCDEEAERVVKSMPKWEPGKQNGRPVNVEFTIPIIYQIDENDKKAAIQTNFPSFTWILQGLLRKGC